MRIWSRGPTSRAIVATAVIVAIASLLVAATGMIRPAWVHAADRWSDISDQAWADTYGITASQAATVADGYPDGTFRPYQPVTRAQFAKMAVKGLGITVMTPASPSFTDVPASHPLFAYVESARAAGVIGGYADGSFRPDAPITRQQTNSILGRFLSNKELQAMGVIWGLQLSYASLEAWSRAEGMFYLGAFSDLGSLDATHRPGSGYLVYHGVVRGSQNGSGFYLLPTASLSRAQAVTMVLRTLAAVDEVAPGAPPAPRDLATFPSTPSAERRPWVSGKAVPGGTVTLFDTFDGATRQVGQILAHDVTGDFSLRVPSEEALAEGVHVFTLRVRNTKGLLSDYSAPINYEVDWTPPVIAIAEPSDGSFLSTGRPAFVAVASDSGSGVLDVTFEYAPASPDPVFQPISIDYLAPYAASWGALELPEGAYLLRASVRDRAGNQAVSSAVSAIVDTTPPAAEIVRPEPAAPGQPVFTVERAPSFVTAAADLPGMPGLPVSGVAEVRFLYAVKAGLPEDPTVGAFTLISAEPLPVEGVQYQATWGELELADGVYTLASYALDRAGNAGPLLMQDVVIDNEAPQVLISAPPVGAQITGGSVYVVAWSAVDTMLAPHPISIEFSPDDGAEWFIVATGLENVGTYAWAVPVPTEDLPSCRLRVTAVDAMGRVGSSHSEIFTVRVPG